MKSNTALLTKNVNVRPLPSMGNVGLKGYFLGPDASRAPRNALLSSHVPVGPPGGSQTGVSPGGGGPESGPPDREALVRSDRRSRERGAKAQGDRPGGDRGSGKGCGGGGC